MSDLMLLGVLAMPYEMAMSDEISRLQFHNRAQQAVARIRSDTERIEQLETALKTIAAGHGCPAALAADVLASDQN